MELCPAEQAVLSSSQLQNVQFAFGKKETKGCSVL